MSETNFEDNNTNVTDDTTNNDTTETGVSEDEVDVEKLQESNKRLYARAKEAEAELKKLKVQPKSQVPNVQAQNNYETDLLKVAKGYDDELLGQLSVIAKGKGVSLINAQEDPMFKLILDKREQESKKEKAKLGASKGSAQFKPVETKGMSRDEHRQWAKEQMAKIN